VEESPIARYFKQVVCSANMHDPVLPPRLRQKLQGEKLYGRMVFLANIADGLGLGLDISFPVVAAEYRHASTTRRVAGNRAK
jgi:hypothetical protein